MATEADTCRTLILRKLCAAGWTDDQIAEQRMFTDGRIIAYGNRAKLDALPAEVGALKRLQAETAIELAAILDKAFKGEL